MRARRDQIDETLLVLIHLASGSGTKRRGRPPSSNDPWVYLAVAGPKLNKISVDGGAVLLLANLSGIFAGASWDEDGIIVAQSGIPMERIPPSGGQLAPVTEFVGKENIQTSPQILPGGNAVLLSANTRSGSETATVEVVSLTDHHRKTLVQGGAFPRYVASFKRTGHLLYTHEGALLAISFDPEKFETRGTAVSIVNDITSVRPTASGTIRPLRFYVSGASHREGKMESQFQSPVRLTSPGARGILGQRRWPGS